MVSGLGGCALTVADRNNILRITWEWYCLVEATMKGGGALGGGTSGQLWYHVVVPIGDHRGTTLCLRYWIVDTSHSLTC